MQERKRLELRGWSYSAWSSLQQCPYRFEQGYLYGVKGPKSWFLEKGIAQHKIAEEYLKGAVTVLPKSFAFFKRHYQELFKRKPIVEQFWGIDEKFRPFEPNWRKGERSWCVMKMDAAVAPTKKEPTLYIQDLKTGKIYDSHIKQGGLYAAIGSERYEDNDGVDVEFWYADQDDIRSYHYSPKRIKELIKVWTERGKDVMSPRKKYKATPSVDACKYCHLRTDKGGPCGAWREVL